jgi:AmiR/NasT family two-component response regulator
MSEVSNKIRHGTCRAADGSGSHSINTGTAGAAVRGHAQPTPCSDNFYHSEFGGLDIAVITDDTSPSERLIRELQRSRARVQHIWPPPDLIPASFDVVYCDLLGDLPQRLPWLPGEPDATLIAIIATAQPLDLKLLHNCAVDAVVCQPVTPQAVRASLHVGRTHFLYQKRLQKRIDKLDDTLRTMRKVDRAKAIIMQSQKISEDEAYHFLRRQAMRRQVTIAVLANVVVDSQGLLS